MAILSNELVSQFVKATADKKETKRETTVYGTITKHDNRTYVKIDGSELLTPVITTTDAEEGERVSVLIKNHTATVNGNITSPSARNETVTVVSGNVEVLNTVVADKVSTAQLAAESARITTLETANVDITGRLTANEAAIENLKTQSVDTEYLKTIFATIESLEAAKADIETLQAEKLSAKDIEGVYATIDSIEGKYANIDFSNITEATMASFYAKSGLIEDVSVNNATIAGRLKGVVISGDLIEANTLVANRLIIQGSDGLYYRLNTNGMVTEAQQTDYNSLNGSVIKAKSIAASKITVADLVAFGATIGGFKISTSSLYSDTKSSVSNTTRGVYLDNTGQVAFGDASSFIKYYKDSSNAYKLDISVDTLTIGVNNTNVESAIASAGKTATDYMNLSSAGLVVGQNPSSPTAGNTLIASDGVNIRKGTSLLAGFKATSRTTSGVSSATLTTSDVDDEEGVTEYIPYTNRVSTSINADGSIYNGIGYKDGYRVRSGGAEGEMANNSCTGYIKVSPGDVIRISGWDFTVYGAGNALNVADASFSNLGQFTMQPSNYGIFLSSWTAYDASSVVEESDGIWKWVVPPAESGVEYIRVSGYATSSSPGSKMIVTINEAIVESESTSDGVTDVNGTVASNETRSNVYIWTDANPVYFNNGLETDKVLINNSSGIISNSNILLNGTLTDKNGNGILTPVNSSGNTTIGYARYKKGGNTYVYGTRVKAKTKSGFSASVNGAAAFETNNANGNATFGWHLYEAKAGETNIYGNITSLYARDDIRLNANGNNVRFNGDIIPYESNTFNLGNPSLAIRDIHISCVNDGTAHGISFSSGSTSDNAVGINASGYRIFGNTNYCTNIVTKSTTTSSTGYSFKVTCGNNPALTIEDNDARLLLYGGTDSTSRYLGSMAVYKRTYSSAANVYVTDSGMIGRSTSSSRRYKKDIVDLPLDVIKGLYELPVRQFKYREDCLSATDERYELDMPGFIAEEVAEYLPIACDHIRDDNGNLIPEMWNSKIVIPALLKLIQDLNGRIIKLEEVGM